MSLTRPQPSTIPLPRPTVFSQPFWEACKRGELTFQRCNDCEGIVFIPQPACTHCLSTDLRWERSAGRGAVYSWTVVWRPQTPAFEIPYAIAIVDVDEGYQMMTNIIGIDPATLEVGRRVEVSFHEMNDEITMPYFRPAA